MIRIYGEDEALIKDRTKMRVEDIPSLIEEGGSYLLMDGELWTIWDGSEVTR